MATLRKDVEMFKSHELVLIRTCLSRYLVDSSEEVRMEEEEEWNNTATYLYNNPPTQPFPLTARSSQLKPRLFPDVDRLEEDLENMSTLWNIACRTYKMEKKTMKTPVSIFCSEAFGNTLNPLKEDVAAIELKVSATTNDVLTNVKSTIEVVSVIAASLSMLQDHSIKGLYRAKLESLFNIRQLRNIGPLVRQKEVELKVRRRRRTHYKEKPPSFPHSITLTQLSTWLASLLSLADHFCIFGESTGAQPKGILQAINIRRQLALPTHCK